MASSIFRSTSLGDSLAKAQFFGSSTEVTAERTDCVSVSIARVEHYRSAADLWRQLFRRELPDQVIQYDDVTEMLRRTGAGYFHGTFVSIPSGKTAFEALHDSWLGAGNQTRFMFGLLFYTRHNKSGHRINFVNLGHSKRMLFLDFQTLRWSQNFSHAAATDRQTEVAQAQTIYIGYDNNRASFEHWEDDSDRHRRSRARQMVEDGYSTMGSVLENEQPLFYYFVYRYSSKPIISRVSKRSIWRLSHDEADLLRDLGVLTARGRLLARQWPRWIDPNGSDGDGTPSLRVTADQRTKWQDIALEQRGPLAHHFANAYTGTRRDVLYSILTKSDDDGVDVVEGRKGLVGANLNPFPLSVRPSQNTLSDGNIIGLSLTFYFTDTVIAADRDLMAATDL